MKNRIIKASGVVEDFDREKFINSIVLSGVSPNVAGDIADKVYAEIPRPVTTNKLFRTARKHLRKHDSVSGMRYSIKKAIYDLGPSGYPFEKYVARILEAYDYKVEVGKIINGHCVKHEVDVIAHSGNDWCMVECKFHQNGGIASDVKVALYVYARFLDVKKAWENSGPPGNPQSASKADAVYHGWLVTNTRLTSDALRFSQCVGLKAIGWKHPKHNSLEKMIERKRIYPVTILPAASKRVLEALVKNDLILAKDIASNTAEDLIAATYLDPDTVLRLKAQAEDICPGPKTVFSER